MLVEVEVAHHTVVVLVPDPQEQVVAKEDHQKEVGHRPPHLTVDQATEVLLVTGPGLSLAPEEDQGHVQAHKMLRDHGNCIYALFNGRQLFEDSYLSITKISLIHD